MRLSLLLAVGFAAVVSAIDGVPRIPGCNHDNCLRALLATKRPGLSDCIAYSSAVLFATPVTDTITSTTTEVVTTVIPDPVDVKRRFIFGGGGMNRRDVALPEYGDKCGGDASRYWSACSCLMGYSIGVTTVYIPPVTVTETTWETVPATATALAANVKFKIFYTDLEGTEYWLTKPPGEDPFVEAEFVPQPLQASELTTLADGTISETDTGRILACEKGGTVDSFLCWFYLPDAIDLDVEEPLKCARTGTDELRCSITDRGYLVWAILDTPAGRRKRDNGQKLMGIVKDKESLGQIEEASIQVGEVSPRYVAQPNNSTTTTQPPAEPTTTETPEEPTTTTETPEEPTTTETPEEPTTTTTEPPAEPTTTTETPEEPTTTTAPAESTAEPETTVEPPTTTEPPAEPEPTV